MRWPLTYGFYFTSVLAGLTHGGNSVSVENNSNSWCVNKENNDTHCSPTDRLLNELIKTVV